MKVTYLAHSGFAVEEHDTVLIFDYFRGSIPELGTDKKVYVFVSHRHYDHYKRKIFDWQEKNPGITYILSDDIPKKEYGRHVIYIGPDSSVKAGHIEVRTFKSTDEGVAFLVYFEGKAIFHAGDLNWWHWEEEGKEYNLAMRQAYQEEIRKIEGISLDVAFIPVDPRLKGQFYYGVDWFMKHTDTLHVFPMHFWEDYTVCEKLKQLPEASGYADRIEMIAEENQVFHI